MRLFGSFLWITKKAGSPSLAGRSSYREYEAGNEELKWGGVEDITGIFLVPLKSRFGLSGFPRSIGALAEVSDHITTQLHSWDFEVICAACAECAQQLMNRNGLYMTLSPELNPSGIVLI